MLLSDHQILARVFGLTSSDPQRLEIGPVLDWNGQLQPSSIDVRLGGDIITFRRELEAELDVFKADYAAVQRLVERHSLRPLQHLVVHPGDFLLATTFESFRLPTDLAARIEGKSSWGRIGLQVHSTAGFVDPGFAGKITIEMSNTGTLPIRLYVGISIAQVCFFELDQGAGRAYGAAVDLGSKYFGQLRTEASRFYDSKSLAALKEARERLKKN
jgi:dCTP deaminase